MLPGKGREAFDVISDAIPIIHMEHDCPVQRAAPAVCSGEAALSAHTGLLNEPGLPAFPRGIADGERGSVHLH